MKRAHPPTFATWLLTRVARRNEALAGDLFEEFRSGRSAAWYWRQTLMAVLVSRTRSILLTLGALGAYWVGTHITIPGANAAALAVLGRNTAGSFRMYNIIVGGNLAPVTIVALGIHPYVTAAILVQLVALVGFGVRWSSGAPFPMLRCTWWTAILLAMVQAAGIALFLERQSQVPGGLPLVLHPGWAFRLGAILTLTTATACLMWISDYITERGIGNGLLLTFLACLAIGLPRTVSMMNAPDGLVGVLPQLSATVAVVAFASYGYRRAIQRERLA